MLSHRARFERFYVPYGYGTAVVSTGLHARRYVSFLLSSCAFRGGAFSLITNTISHAIRAQGW